MSLIRLSFFAMFLILLASACKTAEKKKEGAAANPPIDQQTDQLRAECLARPGYTWINNRCEIDQNSPNIPGQQIGDQLTQAQCLQMGRQWINGQCLESTTTTCPDTSTIAGASQCFNLRVTEMESYLNTRPQGLAWMSNATSDLGKIKTRQQTFSQRQLNEDSGTIAKTQGCYDLIFIQNSASALLRRIDSATAAEKVNAEPKAKALQESVKALKSAVGCLI